MITTLIVDDEPIARQVLRDELAAFGDVAIIGEAENGIVPAIIIVRACEDCSHKALRAGATPAAA